MSINQEATETKEVSSSEVPDQSESKEVNENEDSNHTRKYQRERRSGNRPFQRNHPYSRHDGRQNKDGGGKPFQKGGYKDDHRSQIDYIRDRLFEISGPTLDLEPQETKEKIFNGRNRLWIGNIHPDAEEQEITEILAPFGETSDFFYNKEKHFVFVVYDYHSNAEKAKRELDGTQFRGRVLRIRFSPKNCCVKVENLSPNVTNELLYHGFQVFGDIEKAIVHVDDRGRPTGSGIIDFVRKKSAMTAVEECARGCFFLTNSLRPCIVELYEPQEDLDGFSEKSIQWKNQEFVKEREVGPRFAEPNSFEYEFGTKWKQIIKLYKQKEETIKKELELDEQKLEAQMTFAKYEYETELLKKELENRQMYWEQQKIELEEKERLADETRLRYETDMRRRQEEVQASMSKHDEQIRRHQEESRFNKPHDEIYFGQSQAAATPWNESPASFRNNGNDFWPQNQEAEPSSAEYPNRDSASNRDAAFNRDATSNRDAAFNRDAASNRDAVSPWQQPAKSSNESKSILFQRREDAGSRGERDGGDRGDRGDRNDRGGREDGGTAWKRRWEDNKYSNERRNNRRF